jgi:hypothetical protein
MAKSSTTAAAACFTVGLSATIFSIELVLSGGSIRYPTLFTIVVGLSGGVGMAVGLMSFHRAMSWMPSLVFGVLFGLLLGVGTTLLVVLFYSEVTSSEIYEWVVPTMLATASFGGACLVALLGQKGTYGNVAS